MSRLQVAELVAACCANPGLAANKCLEVVAETEAPNVPYAELLKTIPTEMGRVRTIRFQLMQWSNGCASELCNHRTCTVKFFPCCKHVRARLRCYCAVDQRRC